VSFPKSNSHRLIVLTTNFSTCHFGISKKFRNVGGSLKGATPFKGDSGAIRLPGQGAGRDVWPYAPTSLPGLLPLGGKQSFPPNPLMTFSAIVEFPRREVSDRRELSSFLSYLCPLLPKSYRESFWGYTLRKGIQNDPFSPQLVFIGNPKEVNPGVKSPLGHQLLKEKLKGKVKPNKYILYEELIPLPIKADKRSAL